MCRRKDVGGRMWKEIYGRKAMVGQMWKETCDTEVGKQDMAGEDR